MKGLFYLALLLLSACETQQELRPDLKASAQPTVNSAKIHPLEKIDEDNLWRYITNRSTLRAPSDKDLYWHIDWFKKNPDYLTRVSRRAEPYLYWITKVVEDAGLPIEIALLPIVESAYYPFSYSHGAASGLWQFIPATGKLYGLKDNWWYDGRRDVLASTRAAVRYLKNLNILFDGDWLLAVAAYNSGPGRVQKAILKNKKRGKPYDFWHLDLPIETRGYVPRLLAVTELIKNPKLYGQTITYVENVPKIQPIRLDSQFDLALIAQWSGLDLDELYELNPGLKRWATPSNSSYDLLLPITKVAQFKKNLALHPKTAKVKWLRYQIKAGDNLTVIAKKYHTNINQLKSINRLSSDTIKVGQYLIVPVAQKSKGYYLLSAEQKKQNSKKNGVKIIHKVAKGDSLWAIAKKYNANVGDLIKWNRIPSAKTLQIGDKLVLWLPYSLLDKDLSKITSVGIDINRNIFYTVKSGDTLSAIARKFGTHVSALKQWNKLSNKPLQPGQKLKIIVNVVNSKMQ